METISLAVHKKALEEISWLRSVLKMDLDWEQIEEPTINEVANHLRITADKIKNDLKKDDCPLKVTHKGGIGRGNERRFLKISVDIYAKTLKKPYGNRA